MEFYAAKLEECFNELNSSHEGLTNSQVESNLAKFGKNEFAKTKKKSWIEMLTGQFTQFVMLLLIAAGLVSAYFGDVIDAAFIFLAVVLNGIFGFIQEYKAEKSLEALKNLVSPKARVIRNGHETQIPSVDLVPGDVIILEEGDKIPADARLISSNNLEVNESALTGESMPVQKSANWTSKTKEALADRLNYTYMGTIVVKGNAKALVTSTGNNSEFGKIAKQVSEQEDEKTPLEVKLDDLGKNLGIISIVACIFIFIVGVVYGNPLFSMFLTSVSLAVAAIPEGLPAVVTITLALGMQRMVKRNAVVRKLTAIETLGSTTVICTDKTGTLTKNEMTVEKVVFDNTEINVTENAFELNSKTYDAKKLEKLLTCSALCNNSPVKEENGKTLTLGDPTEAALLVAARKGKIEKKELTNYKFIHEFSFDSHRKMMSVLYETKNKNILFAKGAPEQILKLCTSVETSKGEKKLNKLQLQEIERQNQTLASQAMRVIALAYRELPSKTPALNQNTLEKDLTFLGFAGIIDPARPEAKEAVALCKEAGIRVIMITGDNPLTAHAIASELGIQNSDEVISGLQIDELSDDELAAKARNVNVFARVSPAHKLRIVDALKKDGEIVAMTGDGVNDAPALKRADVGIAMGISGTEVAKEASKMVLLDDNFASIVHAVREGRIIFENISKAVKYLLSSNAGVLLTVLITTIAKLPSPLAVAQILWINMVTDSFPALALGADPGDKHTMKKPPRNPEEQVIAVKHLPKLTANAILLTICALIAFLIGLTQSLVIATTMTFCTIVLYRLISSISMRSDDETILELGLFTNPYLILAVIIAGTIQYLLTILPIANEFLYTTPLSNQQWLLVLLLSLTGLVFLETWKVISKLRKTMKK